MLRSSFLVFVCGWIAWFLMDKPGAGQFIYPESSDDLLRNFQYAFDMLKSGYPGMAFIFIWKHHYIVLSLLCGALLAVLAGSISDHLGRRRMRKLVLPGADVRRDVPGDKQQPGSESTPVSDRESSG